MCIPHSDESVEVAVTRLAKDVVPRHYTLIFTPDLGACTFTGDEEIDLTVKKSVPAIVLNSAELQITDVALTDKFGNNRPGLVTYDPTNELATLTFPGEVGRGSYKLTISFKGVLNDKLHGFYRSLYQGTDGKEHVIASTQMEPADARRAFPCFDEPSFKATYAITLVVDQHLTALSNGRIISTKQLDGGKKAVRFKRTIKMSTYLVALVVGELIESRTVTSCGVKIRVFHIPGKEDLTSFALETAQYAIKWCEKYFGIRYPGDKLDLIAIPDFAFGAMENLGCMIFRETALLVNGQTATMAEMMRVFEVVAHEIVHSWFGDLVTMIWWYGLWLNEAFATFVSHKIMHEAHPEWNVWEAFAAGRRSSAMRTDGLLATRPIQAEVKRASDALGMVDGITYGKGSGTLWQLEQFIGEDVFRDGIRVYLMRHAYGNTENSDLWNAIGSKTKLPVRVMMDSWIFQPGHPVVSISDCLNASGHSSVKLSQERFFYARPEQTTKSQADLARGLAEAAGDHPLESLWLVPVNLRYATAKGVRSRWVLLDKKEKSIRLGKNVTWVVANAGGTGFYRTRYATAVTAKIAVSELKVVERYNLVNDTWACVRAGLVSSTDYLAVIKEFAFETDPNVIGIIIDSLGSLRAVLPKANRPSFHRFVRQMFNPALDRLGWQEKEDEGSAEKQLRGRLITTLGCLGQDLAVQEKAKLLFTQYLADNSSVPGNIVPSLVSIAAYTGDQVVYEEFKRLYDTTANPQAKVRYLQALACFNEEELLRRTLVATTTKAVRTQDACDVLSMLLGSEIKEEAWQFVKDNWRHMVEHFPESKLIGLVAGFASFNTAELEADVRAFLAANPVRGGEKQVAQALENLTLNVRFRQRELERLGAYFAAGPAADQAGS